MTTARPTAVALLAALLTLLLLGVAPVTAAEFRAGDRVTIAAGETAAEDVYIAAGTAVIDGSIQGDLTVAGGMVEVRGAVTGSVNVVGGDVTIAGTVDGAVRAAGGNVTISGRVGRDVVVAGGNVVITADATVGADVAGGVGRLEVGGTVNGDVLSGAGELVIRGRVAGSIDAQTGQLRIESGANVAGDVRYASEREAEIAEGAQIGGAIERSDPVVAANRPLVAENPLTVFLGSLLALLLLGWGLMLLRPSVVVGPGEELRTRPLTSLAAGLATWVGQFLVLIILVVLAAVVGQVAASLGGALLAPFFLVLLGVIAAVLLAQVWVSMAIGSFLAARLTALSPWLAYAIGAAVWVLLLTVLGYIAGGLGGLVFLVGWILGLGAVTLYVIDARRREGFTPTYGDPARYADQPPLEAPPA
jgi:cytoskeletal protein CcmA (bactofilin family)